MGKDVRYQIKDLESASIIEADDFFNGNFRAVTTNLKPTVQVQEKIIDTPQPQEL